jgi:hypothetical protein
MVLVGMACNGFTVSGASLEFVIHILCKLSLLTDLRLTLSWPWVSILLSTGI